MNHYLRAFLKYIPLTPHPRRVAEAFKALLQDAKILPKIISSK
jgi:hypothetical protein